MKYYKILINPTFKESGSTVYHANEAEKLQLINDYWVYSTNTGGDVVNEFNVRNFLDDENNENLSISFFNFLQLNIDNSQFKEIFYDNRKLAKSFNEFYNTYKENELPEISDRKLTKIAKENEEFDLTKINISSTENINGRQSNNSNQIYVNSMNLTNYYINISLKKTSAPFNDDAYREMVAGYVTNELFSYNNVDYVYNVTSDVIYVNKAFYNNTF